MFHLSDKVKYIVEYRGADWIRLRDFLFNQCIKLRFFNSEERFRQRNIFTVNRYIIVAESMCLRIM